MDLNVRIVTIGICVFLCVLVIALTYSDYLFIQGGYTHTRVSLPGYSGSSWVKETSKCELLEAKDAAVRAQVAKEK